MTKTNGNNPNETTSIIELQDFLEKKRQALHQQNNAIQNDFDGLTPSQMYGLLYEPITSNAFPLQQNLATPELTSNSILCQSVLIALDYFASEKGEKLTPQGRWPQKLLKRLHALGDADPRGLDRVPRLEEDWPIASALHPLMVDAGLLRKLKGKMLITKKGRAKLAQPTTALDWIETEYTQHFNWGYLDGYPEVPQYQQHWGFMVWLLLRHGQQERPASFYSEAFLRAWPMFLDELPPDRFEREPDAQFKNLFELRFIQRWLAWMGWAEYRYEGKGFDATMMLKATPVFYQRWASQSN